MAQLIHTANELRKRLPRGCVLVPTMGALHAGHLALIRAARVHADRSGIGTVVVSVFVNPAQFDDSADLERYPRTLDEDARQSAEVGSDLVFAPDVHEMYPNGWQNQPPVELPEQATAGLEDAHRPGHFAGVCLVVKRLLECCDARVAIFGEKDWQQFQVVRAMAATHLPGVKIERSPTVRDPDGLAMSSRNQFLSLDDRQSGLGIVRAIHAAQKVSCVFEAERVLECVLQDHGVVPDYAVVRNASTLRPIGEDDDPESPRRILVAGRAGSVRLLDNGPWGTV